MDGQRRIAGPVKHRVKLKPDVPRGYRAAARVFAVGLIGLALVRGITDGGHLVYAGSPYMKIPGQLAGFAGLAAIDIEFEGLRNHAPDEVLAHIGVKPGEPLLGFDQQRAKARLEKLDWVDSAEVVKRFPNQLHISLVEREPYVIWQYKGALQVVDRKGKPMGAVSAHATNVLLQVVGEGANVAASELLNQMEATLGLRQDIVAAVRVGDRRWDLHMKSGHIIALPQNKLGEALRMGEAKYLALANQNLPLHVIDMRVAGGISYRLQNTAALPAHDTTTTSSIQ